MAQSEAPVAGSGVLCRFTGTAAEAMRIRIGAPKYNYFYTESEPDFWVGSRGADGGRAGDVLYLYKVLPQAAAPAYWYAGEAPQGSSARDVAMNAHAKFSTTDQDAVDAGTHVWEVNWAERGAAEDWRALGGFETVVAPLQ